MRIADQRFRKKKIDFGYFLRLFSFLLCFIVIYKIIIKNNENYLKVSGILSQKKFLPFYVLEGEKPRGTGGG